MTVEVRDEGIGMPAGTQHAASTAKMHGMGLSGMRERVRELGGKLEVHSNGNGTTITAALPLVTVVAIGA